MGARMLTALMLSVPFCSAPPEAVQSMGYCKDAGDRLEQLGCPEARTPAGAPFAEACEAAAEDGRDWRADCIAQISSCAELQSAYNTPEGEVCPE